MRIRDICMVRSGGPNFIPSVRGPARLVRSEKYTQPPNVAITENPPPEMNSQVTTEVPNITHTRSGRISAPPSRLVEDHDWH